MIAALRSFRTSKLADVIVLGLWIGVWALVLGGWRSARAAAAIVRPAPPELAA